MKTMTFEAAKRKLAKIAAGEYHTIQYELQSDAKEHGGKSTATCAVYIHGTNWYSSETWAGAFAMLKAGMDRRKKHAPDRKEQPA